MRLKNDHSAASTHSTRLQGDPDLLGMMPVVINNPHTALLSLPLEPSFHASESCQRSLNGFEGQLDEVPTHSHCSQRIQDIVPSRNREFDSSQAATLLIAVITRL
jgi:hypothetical protein